MRVLLVDDHPLARNSITSLLTANNIEVVGEASDGLEALEKAQQLTPDVILMDLWMPGCNGLEATRLIKAEMPQTRIIILTALDDDEGHLRAIRSGAEGYLSKMFKAEELLALLSKVTKGERSSLEGDQGQHQILINEVKG